MQQKVNRRRLGPRPPRSASTREPPDWLKAMQVEYDRLAPAIYESDDRRAPAGLVNAWIEALGKRFAYWCELEEKERSKSVARGDRIPIINDERKGEPSVKIDKHSMIQRRNLPSFLVIPWQSQNATTLEDPGFAMWFNMDASDSVLGKGLETTLRRMRNRAINRQNLPSSLIVPWGSQKPLEVDGKKIEGDLEENVRQFNPGDTLTLNHPGFAMWFNMAASDRVLQEDFNSALGQARERWPFIAKVRGRGSKNPEITKDIFRKWHDEKIVQLFDLDYYFLIERADAEDRRPTLNEMSNWIYGGKEVSNPKLSYARAMLREAMSYLPAMYHISSPRIWHVDTDAVHGNGPHGGAIANPITPATDIVSTPAVTGVHAIVTEALARAEPSRSKGSQLGVANEPTPRKSFPRSARGRPVDYKEVDWPK
jgi:hypothetical protein